MQYEVSAVLGVYCERLRDLEGVVCVLTILLRVSVLCGCSALCCSHVELVCVFCMYVFAGVSLCLLCNVLHAVIVCVRL